MLIKLRQQLRTHDRSATNKVHTTRSRIFIAYYVQQLRLIEPSSSLRATGGFVQWLRFAKKKIEDHAGLRAECFITGRSRGTSRRFTVARTKIKELSGKARLFGVRKASW